MGVGGEKVGMERDVKKEVRIEGRKEVKGRSSHPPYFLLVFVSWPFSFSSLTWHVSWLGPHPKYTGSRNNNINQL